MRLTFLVSTILLSVGACTGSIAGPSSTSADASSTSLLDGNWATQRNASPVPAWNGVGLSLATNGLMVTGTAHQIKLQYQYSFTITGQQSSDATSFSLTFTSDGGTVATHSGRMVGSDEFRLEWGQEPWPDSLTFFREPQ